MNEIRDNIVQMPARQPRLRSDVPPFDATNPAHLRAWEAMYDFGVVTLRSQQERDR
jgi:hypothetical protein